MRVKVRGKSDGLAMGTSARCPHCLRILTGIVGLLLAGRSTAEGRDKAQTRSREKQAHWLGARKGAGRLEVEFLDLQEEGYYFASRREKIAERLTRLEGSSDRRK